MLQIAKQSYERINLAGHINDVWLKPEAINVQAAINRGNHFVARGQRPADPQPLPRRLAHAFEDMGHHFQQVAMFTLNQSLVLQRAWPLYGMLAEVWWIPALGGIKYLAPAYPVAELLVGRGHTLAEHVPRSTGFIWSDDFFMNHDYLSHHGLLGLVFEAMPLHCAAALEAREHRTMATACMFGAVVGRGILQLPRIAVLASAALCAGVIALTVAAVILAVEMVIRGTYACARDMLWLLDYDLNAAVERALHDVLRAGRREQAPTALPEDDVAIDPGGHGIHDRVRARTTRLIGRLEPFVQTDNSDADLIQAEIERSANDLRRYCSAQTTTHALRGGLRLLKDFIDITWDEEEGIAFNPVELGDIDPTAQHAA